MDPGALRYPRKGAVPLPAKHLTMSSTVLGAHLLGLCSPKGVLNACDPTPPDSSCAAAGTTKEAVRQHVCRMSPAAWRCGEASQLSYFEGEERDRRRLCVGATLALSARAKYSGMSSISSLLEGALVGVCGKVSGASFNDIGSVEIASDSSAGATLGGEGNSPGLDCRFPAEAVGHRSPSRIMGCRSP